MANDNTNNDNKTSEASKEQSKTPGDQGEARSEKTKTMSEEAIFVGDIHEMPQESASNSHQISEESNSPRESGITDDAESSAVATAAATEREGTAALPADEDVQNSENGMNDSDEPQENLQEDNHYEVSLRNNCSEDPLAQEETKVTTQMEEDAAAHAAFADYPPSDDSDVATPSRPSWKRRITKIAGRLSPEEFSKELRRELRAASESLLDLLFAHLSSSPTSTTTGLTLPAAAVGWISLQLYTEQNSTTAHQASSISSSPMFPASSLLRDRLSLLRFVLPRATHVRLTCEEWPRVSSNRKRRQRRRNWIYLQQGDAELSPFLAYYDSLISRPRIDMRVFPKCQVLLLDHVEMDWVENLASVRESLQLIRVESCRNSRIINLGKFLGTSNLETFLEASSSQDPLAPSPDAIEYPRLTHIKISNCNVEDSLSDLERLSNLQSLSLTHAGISSQDALSGMAFLNKLDLSFNSISSLQRVHYHLGNIQTLVLSHNHLTSTEGIDRLLALKTLWIDHNEIEDLSQIRGLARLPELENIRAEGNPIELRAPRKFRVEFLDLFREKRFHTLPRRSATYRDLLNLLPILDEQKASWQELKALVNRSYLAPTTVVDLSSETGICERHASAIEPVRPSKRKIKPRRALVDATAPLVALHRTTPRSAATPMVDFSLNDVLESLCPPTPAPPAAVEDVAGELPPDMQNADEVKKVPVEDEDSSNEESRPADIVNEGEEGAKAVPVEAHPESTEVEREEKKEDAAGSEILRDGQGEDYSDQEKNTGDPPVFQTGGDVREHPSNLEPIQSDEYPPRPIEGEDDDTTDFATTEEQLVTVVSASDNEHSSLKELLLSPSKRDQTEEMKTSASTAATDANGGGSSDHDAFQADSLSEMARPRPEYQNRSSSDETSPESPTRLSMSFPDVISSDDQSSVQSSVGTPHRSGARKYHLAEENSTYDGPETCRKFLISSDLELYFRLFVFPHHKEDDIISRSTADGNDEMSDWRSILKQYPRIQLCPTDRLLRETGNEQSSQPEEFRRLWKEKVVGCGEAALRRLTPNACARYGFHGELLWSDSTTSSLKPEMVVENREVVACLSSTCLYFIVDHDKVTSRTESSRRKFPRPISKAALFEEAVWPHALARHPIATLRAITIGFGFQRLTLRFGASASRSPSDFTYILLTSNKRETVSLFKELQDLVQENQVSANIFADGPEETIAIENDDRHVLDALGVAVAPDVLGVVLHYQVLGQQWRRGDRGVVRRVCVVTDTKLFLLDEDYVGDGSKSYIAGGNYELGETLYSAVDSAGLDQVIQVQAADAEPNSITIVIRPNSTFQKTRNWRLVTRDREGAERLVEDVRRAISLIE